MQLENEGFGVDIGGRFTLVAKSNCLRAEVVLTDGQRRELENVIVFKDHTRLIGALATESYRANIMNAIRGFSIQGKKTFNYKGQQINLECYQLLGAFLRSILKDKKNIVISYPDFYTQQDLVNLWRAIQISKSNIIAAMPENMAISNYVNYCQNIVQQRNLIIIDFGHTKFSAFLLQEDRVLCEVFNREIGTHKFDIELSKWILKQKNVQNIDLNNKNHLKLIDSCEKFRKELSANSETSIDVEWIDFYFTLKRKQYEEIISEQLKQIKQLCENLNQQTKTQQVDLIITLGGGSRIPIVQELFRSVFSNREFQSTIHATEAICQGCSVANAIIEQRQQNQNQKGYFINLFEPYPIYIGKYQGNTAIPQIQLREFFVQNGECIKFQHGLLVQLNPSQQYKITIFYSPPPIFYPSKIKEYLIQNQKQITFYYDYYGIIQICGEKEILIPLNDQNQNLLEMIKFEDEMEQRDLENQKVDEVKYIFERKIMETENKAKQSNLSIRQFEKLGQYLEEAKQYLLKNDLNVLEIQQMIKQFENDIQNI